MEYNTASPIYLQVINELKKRMVKGELKPGEKMPSNRELAVLFKVNQNTAARIYREMESMGLCYTKRGIGTFVSEEDDMISGLKKEMGYHPSHPWQFAGEVCDEAETIYYTFGPSYFIQLSRILHILAHFCTFLHNSACK